jgi:hypothetical protein
MNPNTHNDTMPTDYVSDDDIRALRREALMAGDEKMAEACRIALIGHFEYRNAVTDIIRMNRKENGK